MFWACSWKPFSPSLHNENFPSEQKKNIVYIKLKLANKTWTEVALKRQIFTAYEWKIKRNVKVKKSGKKKNREGKNSDDALACGLEALHQDWLMTWRQFAQVHFLWHPLVLAFPRTVYAKGQDVGGKNLDAKGVTSETWARLLRRWKDNEKGIKTVVKPRRITKPKEKKELSFWAGWEMMCHSGAFLWCMFGACLGAWPWDIIIYKRPKLKEPNKLWCYFNDRARAR